MLWLLVSVAAAVTTYRLVENPVRHARVWTGRRWLPVAVGLVLVATSLGVATVAIQTHDATPAGGTSTADITPLTPATVSGVVAASRFITRLPANLAPTLAGVRDDSGVPPGGCWPSNGQSTVPACIFGDVHGSRTVVLYGDSHAAMWFDAVNLIATAAHWRLVVLTKGSCPAIDLPFANPLGFGPAGGVFVACNQWHRSALDRIRAIRPDLVLLSDDAELPPGGGSYSTRRLAGSIIQTIRELPLPSSRVIVIGNIPQISGGGPECLSLHPDSVQQCSGQSSPYTAEHAQAELLGAAQAGAKPIDTVPWFCSTVCTDVIGRFQPYYDAYHVNATYSAALAPVLGAAIDLGSYPPLHKG